MSDASTSRFFSAGEFDPGNMGIDTNAVDPTKTAATKRSWSATLPTDSTSKLDFSTLKNPPPKKSTDAQAFPDNKQEHATQFWVKGIFATNPQTMIVTDKPAILINPPKDYGGMIFTQLINPSCALTKSDLHCTHCHTCSERVS